MNYGSGKLKAAAAKPRLARLGPALALCALLAPSGLSAEAGRSGGAFLRVVGSPRAAGMGEAGAALYGDLLGALSLNPAALARTGYKEAAAAHNAWLEGMSEQHAAYAHPFRGAGVAALFFSAAGSGDIDAYTASDAYAGTVKAGSLAAGAAYAGRLAGPGGSRRLGLFAGAAVTRAQEKLDTVSASATLFDAGLLSVSRIGGNSTLNFGLSARSLGRGYRFDSAGDPPPTVLRAGAGLITMLGGDPLSFAVDAVKPNDGDAYLAAGLEMALKRTLMFRGGYRSGAGTGGGLRLGVGFLLKLLQLDYSLASHGEFGLAHRIGLSYKFGKPMEVTPYVSPEQERAGFRLGKAKLLLSERRFYEAVLELNEALRLDPNLPGALELMRKARAGIETERR